MRRFCTAASLAAILSVTLLTSCAVLRIDVDVYKGPLANHREVQKQQLWSMALAAHPLLVELRDTTEWDRTCARFSEFLIPDNFIKEDRRRAEVYAQCIVYNRDYSSEWYKYGYVNLEDVSAKFKNVDSGKQDGKLVERKIEPAAASGTETNENADISRKIENVERKLSEVERQLDEIKKKLNDPDFPETMITKQLDRYHEFERLRTELIKYNLSLASDEDLKVSLDRSVGRPPLLKLNVGFREYQAQRLNTILELYGDPSGGETGTESPATKKNEDAVAQEIRTQFTAATEEGNQHKTKALAEDEKLNQDDWIERVRGEWHGYIRSLDSVRQSGWIANRSLNFYWRQLAGTIAKTTNIIVLSQAMKSGQFSRYEDWLLRDLQDFTRKEGVAWPLRDTVATPATFENVQRVISALTDAIHEYPYEYLLALQYLDVDLKALAVRGTGPQSELVKIFGADYAKVVANAGLVWPGADIIRSIISDKEAGTVPPVTKPTNTSVSAADGARVVDANKSDKAEISKTIFAGEAAKQAAAVAKKEPLGSLRSTSIGIKTQAKEYSEAKNAFDEECPEFAPDQGGKSTSVNTFVGTADCEALYLTAQGKERVLTNELASFAEKILTIANNDNLFRSRNSNNQLSGFGQKQLNRFVIVLQSVGNAILVQADELRRQASHDIRARRSGAKDAEISEILGRFGDGCAADDAQAPAPAPASTPAPATAGSNAPSAAPLVPVVPAPVGAGQNQGAGQAPAAQPQGCKPKDLFRVHALKGKDTDTKTAMEALDRLIAALRNEKVKATLNLPGETAKICNPETYKDAADKDLPRECMRLKQVTDALNLAYQHRSGMVYIRPPGAYLRTSFAATNLQGDPNLAWQNMLAEQYRRSMPLYGEFKKLEEGSEGQIKAEIDKRFWQNINSVRVAGTGRTDFVLVKDDIGNWYVKGVSADPRDVFNAAQSLALFGVGGGIGANLLLQRNLERDLLKAENEADRTRIRDELKEIRTANRASVRDGGTGLAGVLDTYVTRYVKESDKAFGNAAGSVTHADYQTFVAAQIRDLTAPVANVTDRAAIGSAIDAVRTSADVQTVYTSTITPKITVPAAPLPTATMNTAAEQSEGMIAAANGLIAAAAAADSAVSALDLEAAVSGTGGTATAEIANLKQQKVAADAGIAAHQANLATAEAKLLALDAVMRTDGTNASAETKNQHATAGNDVNRTRQMMLADMQTRDDIVPKIAVLEARLQQANNMKRLLAQRLRGYFRGKINTIYAARKALNDQLDTAVSVISTSPGDAR